MKLTHPLKGVHFEKNNKTKLIWSIQKDGQHGTDKRTVKLEREYPRNNVLVTGDHTVGYTVYDMIII